MISNHLRGLKDKNILVSFCTYCQRDCECMDSVGEDEIYLITRDLAVASLPHECGPDPGDGDDDWYQPLNKWNVSKVTNMGWMFEYAESFNQPLNDWNVSNVNRKFGMFDAATSFNQPLHAPWFTLLDD